MKRNLRIGAIFLAVLAALGIGSTVLDRAKAVVEAAGIRRRASKWIRCGRSRCPTTGSSGTTIGVSVDAQDHIWIIHRGARSKRKEDLRRGQSARRAECCSPAPPVLEFDEEGNLIGHWGGPRPGLRLAGVEPRHHGRLQRQRLDRRQRQRPAPARRRGAAAAARAAADGDAAAAAGRGRRRGYYHDNMILKFTQDGKFLMQIGKPGQSKGSNDTENLKGAGQDVRRSEDQRAVRRRRLRQPSRDRLRRRYRQVQAPLGRLRPQARRHQPRPLQSGRPARAAVPQSGALRRALERRPALRLRPRQRPHPGVQAGRDVRQGTDSSHKNTLGDGSVWDIAFSKDPQQKYIYPRRRREREDLHHPDRESLEVLTSFGDGGRQPGEFYAVHSIATDSKGNIYTTETYRGQRVQKFVYKGLAPVTKQDQGVVWPKTGEEFRDKFTTAGLFQPRSGSASELPSGAPVPFCPPETGSR